MGERWADYLEGTNHARFFFSRTQGSHQLLACNLLWCFACLCPAHERQEALLRRRVYTAYVESGGEGGGGGGREGGQHGTRSGPRYVGRRAPRVGRWVQQVPCQSRGGRYRRPESVVWKLLGNQNSTRPVQRCLRGT